VVIYHPQKKPEAKAQRKSLEKKSLEKALIENVGTIPAAVKSIYSRLLQQNAVKAMP